MKRGGKITIGLACGLAWQLHAGAVTSENAANPYSAIVDRNVFNLRPPPPPTPPTPPADTQPSKITLLGIVSGFGPKQVMFKTPVGTPPKETSFALSEGERADDFEVIEINELAGSVRLRNHGQEETLTLEKHGMKPTGAAPAIPGVPVPPGGQRIPPPVPVPGQPAAAGIPAPASGSAITTFGAGATTPTRPLRVSATSSGVAGPGFGGTALTQPHQPTTTPQAQQPAMTAEEQMVLMEINRKLTEDQVKKGLMPPLPPTPLTGK